MKKAIFAVIVIFIAICFVYDKINAPCEQMINYAYIKNN